MQSGLVALSYSDGNLTSMWLTDQSQTKKVAELLTQPANQSAAGIQKVLWGESLKLVTNDPLKDNRMPDYRRFPNVGVVYSEAGDTAIAAHGGFSDDDTHVLYWYRIRVETQNGQSPGSNGASRSDNPSGSGN